MTTLIGWGSTQYGQLGTGASEEGKIETPTVVKALQGEVIKQNHCGEFHTLFLLKSGVLYSCGNNENGQLGHNKRTTRPGQIDDLSKIHTVTQASCGSRHNLALTQAGEVFSWGDNSCGQLGRGQIDSELWRVPKLIKQLVPHTVIQVSCGRNHSICLADDGKVFTWGENQYGQLGIGDKNSYNTPLHVSCLMGIPISQVAAGFFHSFILSQSGAVYGWGRNSFGQLGVNDEKDRPNPTLCKSLRSQKIKYITCGEDHTAALTQEGGVFTFGSGTYGQLGHGTKNNEILPRKIMELMGSEVTQIATGRRHTVAYVADSGRLYTFGSGILSQLGTGEKGVTTLPTRVKGPFLPHSLNHTQMDTDSGPMFVVHRIAAGGDHCFVIGTDPELKEAPCDFREFDSSTQIKSLTADIIDKVSCLCSSDDIDIELEQDVNKVFSTASCLNASFLVSGDGHFGSSSRKHGVDMKAVRENFQKLAETSNIVIVQKIAHSIENCLITSLPTSPPDVEALRLYLILPELHLFDQPKNFSALMDPFGNSILNLDKPGSRVLDLWWGSLSDSFFHRVVYVYKETVKYILQLPNLDPKNYKEISKRYHALYVSLEVLKKLNHVNEQNGQVIPYSSFYINDLKDKVDIKSDYLSWVQLQHPGKYMPGMQQKLLFCNYPFTFNAVAKSVLLQTDALMQMQSAIDEVQRRNFQSFFLPINPVHPCLVFLVSRDNIVQDTLQQLMQQGSGDLKKPLKVIFKGEEAEDEGGVRKVTRIAIEAWMGLKFSKIEHGSMELTVRECLKKTPYTYNGSNVEFFMLLLRELLDPKYGMFKYYEESRLQWFAPVSFEEREMFLLVGCLCGLAIYNAIIIQLRFPLALYKKLLNRVPGMEDLIELTPRVGKSFEQLLAYEEDDLEEIFCLHFELSQECFGEVKTVELVPGGSSKAVNKENRKEFVEQYVSYIFDKSVEEQFAAFNTGFHKVCGGRVLELFHPQELRAMVVGNENYDFHEMEKNTQYKGEYHRYHQTIKFFWDVFHDLSLEDKKKFLLFLTGSDTVPITGMKSMKVFIQPMHVGESFLPVAHTCFNLLDLPKYSSKETMKQKLLQAIQQTEGFGLV